MLYLKPENKVMYIILSNLKYVDMKKVKIVQSVFPF